MVIDLNYSVDIRKGVMPQHVTQPLYYDDQNAHRINVSLYRGQQEIDLTGLSCNGYVTFVKDGTSIGPLVGEVSGNTCSVVLPHEAYYYPGAIRIEVKLVEGEEVTTVLMLTGQVSAGRGDHVIDIDGAIVPSLERLSGMINEVKERLEQLDTIEVVEIADVLFPVTKSTSYNLLDIDRALLQDGYVTGAPKFTLSASSKTLVYPLTEGVTYTFSRKNAGARLRVAFSDNTTAEAKDLAGYVMKDGADITFTVPAGYPYMYLFFYHASYDTSVDWALEEAQIVEGTAVRPYAPYGRIIEVDANHLADAVNADIAKGVAAYNAAAAPDAWNTRHKVYGIQFDTEATDPDCTRIANAAGMTVADFDNVFPWCEMRRCAVTINGGRKVVVYEGEAGYSVDGSAGNVMVEIPAFYVLRERIDTIEKWMISGTQYGGFELHPWFINPDGSTVTHRYFGAYEARDNNSGVFSVSGARPYNGNVGDSSDYLASKFRAYGFNRHSLQAWSALQFLFVVEYATRNSQSVYHGSSYQLYYYPEGAYSACEIVRDITLVDGHSKLKMDRGSMFSGNSLLFSSAGQQVYIGADSRSGVIRTILDISYDSSYIYATVDGDPVTLVSGLAISGIPQTTGHTDVLTTPSGYEPGADSHVCSFRYRGIENPWGNLWEVIDGLRFKNGVYYISNDPTVTSISDMEALTYSAPKILVGDKSADNWIKRMGYDVNNRAYILPDTLFTDNGTSVSITTDGGVVTRENVTLRGGKYYGDAFYSIEDTTTTLYYAIGGGWDHHENAGLFCARGIGAAGYLYGERLMC